MIQFGIVWVGRKGEGDDDGDDDDDNVKQYEAQR